MNLRMFSASLALAALAVSLTGCNSGTATGDVKGAVSIDGQPLKQGTIMFQPTGGRPGYGKIVDGQIVEVNVDGAPGAPLGANQVTIQAIEGGADMYAPTKSLVPARYGNPEQSGLTANIEGGKPNDLKFELKSEGG